MNLARVGVYGLGTMGGALALNLAEKGFDSAICDRIPARAEALAEAAADFAGRLWPEPDVAGLVARIERPRILLLMIPSGAPVEDAVSRIAPLMEPGDLVVDAGNSDFHDTRRRSADLARAGLHFVGMGVSGGAEGARYGPSMMVGSNAEAWARLRPVAEAVVARYHGAPCVALLGPDGAGHFVKTVHNGIEYADMQMIAEIYGLLRDGHGWRANRIADRFDIWNDGPLASYLTEITAEVLRTRDEGSGRALVNMILDKAGQNGTGRWTVIEAQRLGQSASTIEAAVAARAWSAQKSLREVAAEKLSRARTGLDIPEPEVLGRALLAGRILAHAQGFDLLAAGSDAYGWALDRARIAEIWRAGCIIRSALMNEIAVELRREGAGAPLVMAPQVRALLAGTVGALRRTVAAAVQAGFPAPALSGALAWYDSLRQASGTANLIQAQRDFFGSHGFQRVDREGDFHGAWPKREGKGT